MWPPSGPFWSVKYLNFGQKLPIRTARHTSLESRHPEVTKNPYVLSPEWNQKKVSAHGLSYIFPYQGLDTLIVKNNGNLKVFINVNNTILYLKTW